MGGKASTLKLKLDINGKCNGQCTCPDGKKLSLEAKKETNSPVNGFNRYNHSLPNGNTFTLDITLQDGGKIGTRGKPISGVKEVSVFYWSKNEETKPLLLGVTITTTPIYYVRSNGNDWNFISQSPSDEFLSEQLDYQNCEHNDAVTIDLSKGLSTKNGSHHNYCCSGNHVNGAKGSNRVTVTSTQISCKNHKGSAHLTYYKHTVNTSGRLMLAAIKYNDGYYGGKTSRRRIKPTNLATQTFPFSDVTAVYAFYCGNNPELIYVECGGSAQGWYHKSTTNSSSGNNGNDKWTPTSELQDITPDNINNCGNEGWNKLREELKKFPRCQNYLTCTPPEPPPTTQAQADRSASGSTAGNSGPGPSHGGSFWDKPTNTIPTVLTGVGVVSGTLTVLAYLLYNNSRDPWVRQI